MKPTRSTPSAAPNPASPHAAGDATVSTLEAARELGMAVRSVQMMVDRGELQAWKTPGGHRRIWRASLDRWLAERSGGGGAKAGDTPRMPAAPPAVARPHGLRVLLIEDSVHFQSLISLLIKRHLPEAELHVANDGIAGLALAGRLEPDVLLVDILLPGIDGATLITSLRSHPQFGASRLLVVTSLDEAQRSPYAFALDGLPVVHKTRLVQELPARLAELLPGRVVLAAPAAG